MKNRKKRIKCIVACIFLVLVYCLSACGREKEKEEVQPKEKEQTEIQESKEEIENEIKKEAEKETDEKRNQRKIRKRKGYLRRRPSAASLRSRTRSLWISRGKRCSFEVSVRMVWHGFPGM